MKNCEKCSSELVFIDDSWQDDCSSGYYVCGKCHEIYSIEEVEK